MDDKITIKRPPRDPAKIAAALASHSAEAARRYATTADKRDVTEAPAVTGVRAGNVS